MEASVTVHRNELTDALTTLRRTTERSERGEAVLSFEDGHLVIHCGGASVQVPAEGNWPGRLRMNSAALLGLSKNPPEENHLELKVGEGRIYFGTLAISGTWDETERELVTIPMNANLFRLLQVDQQYSDDVLEGSGLMGKIREARKKRTELLEKASAALAPLRIGRDDLEDLLEARLASEEEVESLLGSDQQNLPLELDGDQLGLGS